MAALCRIGSILLEVITWIWWVIATVIYAIVVGIIGAWKLLRPVIGCATVIAVVIAVIATAVWLGVHGLHLP